MLGGRSKEQEKRQYIRLDSVFPVDFCLLSLDGKQVFSDWIQGFTNNISRGGICLSVNNLSPAFAELIKTKQVRLSLRIEIPLNRAIVETKATVAWTETIAKETGKYLIGLAYEDIPAALNNRIFHYALTKKLVPRLGLFILLVLLIGFSISSYLNIKLIRGNKALIEQLVGIVQKSSLAKQEIKQLTKEREELDLKLSEMEIRFKTLEEEKKKILQAEQAHLIKEAEAKEKITGLLGLIKQLESEKSGLQERLSLLHKRENKVTADLLLLDKKKVDLEKANFEKMYQWLKLHQNSRTGLVLSQEGAKDIANLSFLYDQALVAISYVNFADFERVRKILDFFKLKAKKINGGFVNAYYTNSAEAAENTVQGGSNIWLGIAVLHYTQKTQDKSYLVLAKTIADWIADLQNQGEDDQICVLPPIYCYSSEHNLGAYTLFTMLYEITQEARYSQAAARALEWLKLHIYDKEGIPVIRGKEDSSVATNTYAWSIAALGPEKLETLGINPEKIIEFAEDKCVVETEYIRPTGEKVSVKGFSFAPESYLSRAGVVSSECTAQMILAYKLMSRFYYKKDMIAKARSYEFKADEYMSQLLKLIISSPSPSGMGEGCLAPATQANVDIRYSLAVPKGKATGSVAATAYTLFAYYGHNPLELTE